MATLSSKARPLGVATSAQGALADTAVQPGDSPTFASVDINGGDIDGTAIGIAVASTARFTEAKTSELNVMSGGSIAMTAHNVVYNTNNGSTAEYNLPGALSGANNNSSTAIWLVTIRGYGDATNGYAGTFLITWWGSSTANMASTILQATATGGNAGVGVSRFDPGGGAPHKLRVSSNNYAVIRYINAIKL
jgi:hypothetical protein